MNYRLNRQGVDLGVFSLEELQRRRQSGEFTGAEYVLADGAMEWQLLDVTLQQADAMPPVITANTPRKSNRKWIWIAVGCGGGVLLIVVAAAVVLGWQMMKTVRQNQGAFQPNFQTQTEGDPVAEASKAVAPTNSPMTATDTRTRARKFRERQWIEGYEQRGQRDKPCDADALLMLKGWMAEQYGTDQEADLPPFRPLVEQLSAQPDCDDPLVLVMMGVETKDIHQRIQMLERALNGFEKSRHRAYPKFYAAVMLAADSSNNGAKVADLDATANRYFVEMFKDGTLLPEDQPEMAEIIIYGWGARFFSQNQRTIYKAVPDKKEFKWLRLVLEGRYHVNEAWRRRGGGYVNTVTEQGKQGFEEEMGKAVTCFSGAYELRPGWALAPAEMTEVAMGIGGIREMRLWFDRATAAQIDYAGAWREMRWGLRPRWYGSEEAMLAFGATEVNTERFDTDVPRMLFDSITDIESEENLRPWQHIYGREDVWPLLQKMYEGYIAEPSQSGWRDGWRSTYAAISYVAGHYDVSRAQLEAAGTNLWTNNLRGYGMDLSMMPLEVTARTSRASNAVNQAEALRGDGDIKGALKTYQDLDKTNLDARTTKFVAARLASLDLERRLHNGEWVDILPTSEKDPAWVVERGTVRSVTNGVLEVESDEGGHLMYSQMRLGTADFEVRGEFEIVQSTTKNFQAGLIVGLPEYDGKQWVSFRMKRNETQGEVAEYSHAWTKGTLKPARIKDGVNSFSFRWEEAKLTATVNGGEVFRNESIPKAIYVPDDQLLLGIGAHGDKNVALVRYSHLQVRWLGKPDH